MDPELLASLITKVPLYLGYICQVLGVVCILATVFVRTTPSKSDDEKVAKIVKKIWAVISWFPTIGMNPKTKELMETYKNITKEDK